MSAQRYRRGPVAAIAAAGADQAAATAVSAELVNVTAADGAKGVRLPTAVPGGPPRIIHNAEAAQNLLVYPATGAAIDAGAANAAFTLSGGQTLILYPHSATQWYTVGAITGLSGGELAFLDGVTAGTPLASKALVLGATKNIGSFRMTGKLFTPQAAPETSIDTVSLTDAQMLSGILVATPTAAAAYTVRTGTQLEAALLAAGFQVENGDCFDLTIINLGGAGDDITLTAAAGITIVGNAVITVAVPSQGTFRFRRTAANTFVAYRVG